MIRLMHPKTIISLAVVLICNVLNGFSQTYTITSNADNDFVPPYQEGTLRWAVNEALTYANAGGQATIIFRVENGVNSLCELEESLPVIQITNPSGSIVFDKATVANLPDQGIKFAGDFLDASFLHALNINNNHATSSVQIKNLRFNGFNGSNLSGGNNRRAIQVTQGKNITVNACSFFDYWIGVGFYGQITNSSIKNNFFFNNGSINESVDLSLTDGISDVLIENNNFQITGVDIFVSTSISVALYDNFPHQVNISGNIISGNATYTSSIGISIQNFCTSSNSLNITSNIISDCDVGINYSAPFPSWTLTNNQFQRISTVNIACNGSTLSNLYGFKIITTSGISGYTPFNTGNSFADILTSGSGYSISAVSNFGAKVELIGLNLKGRVGVGNGNPTNDNKVFIRGTKIVTNQVDAPIDKGNVNANNGILPPSFTLRGSVYANVLRIPYTLNEPTSVTGNLILDFYESNANGDLVNYIGSETQTGNGSYTSNVAVPVNLNLGANPRIAVTVTSAADGTSEAAYTTIDECPSLSVEITASEAPQNRFSTVASCQGGLVTFTNTTSPLPPGTTFVWDFGDGSPTSTAFSPTHVYNTTGTFTVTTTVNSTQNNCQSGSVTNFIVVSNCCPVADFDTPNPVCADGVPNFFTNTSTGALSLATAQWDFGDGTSSSMLNPAHLYSSPGTYQVTLTMQGGATCSITTHQETVTVQNCTEVPPCTECIGSFAPDAGDYVLSAWVKQSNSQDKTTYDYPEIYLEFAGVALPLGPFKGSGAIIDGWQRVEATITIPTAATDIKVRLKNASPSNDSKDVFFDDIRMQPFNSHLKTFVYDPNTLRLMAELDDRNYATFYQYDQQGMPVVVKKETERGIITVKETRSNTTKR